MTGPEHYRVSERLVETANRELGETEPDRMRIAELFAAAQVHATLALAAATAMNGYDETGSRAEDFLAWKGVCGVREPASDLTGPDRLTDDAPARCARELDVEPTGAPEEDICRGEIDPSTGRCRTCGALGGTE